jgi:hypothetical protein
LDSFDPDRLHARNGFRRPRFFSSGVRSSTGFRAADEDDDDDDDDELDEDEAEDDELDGDGTE